MLDSENQDFKDEQMCKFCYLAYFRKKAEDIWQAQNHMLSEISRTFFNKMKPLKLKKKYFSSCEYERLMTYWGPFICLAALPTLCYLFSNRLWRM